MHAASGVSHGKAGREGAFAEARTLRAAHKANARHQTAPEIDGCMGSFARC